MLDAIMYIVAAWMLPVLINKTTEKYKLNWIQDHIRPLWMMVFTLLTIFFIHRSELSRLIMNHFLKSNISPIIQYIIIGFSGAIIFCLYWWFTGIIFSGPYDNIKIQIYRKYIHEKAKRIDTYERGTFLQMVLHSIVGQQKRLDLINNQPFY